MKTRNTKLPAFTIMETIIVMLVTAALIGLTYATYTIVSKSYQGFVKKNKAIETAVVLDKLLKKDFFKAASVSRDNSTILFKTDTASVSYDFHPDFITRTQGITDTFRVKTMTMSTTFEHRTPDEVSPETHESLLDDLALTIILQDKEIPYHYHIQYSSANLFQTNPDASH